MCRRLHLDTCSWKVWRKSIQGSEASITVILARKTVSTTPNSKEVSTNKCNIDGQPEIATRPSNRITYISESVTDITTVSTRASSQKVSTSDYNIERQQEIAIWPPKPEIIIPLELRPLELRQIGWQFQRQIWGFRPRSMRGNWPRVIATRNRKWQYWRFGCQSCNW